MTSTAMKQTKLDWTNTLSIGLVHLVGIFAIVYMAAIHFSWWTLGLGVIWFGLCGLAITGGYHRLFSHPTYQARWPLRLFYLCFGAAAAQNSALKWSADHRLHHSKTDREEDPYNINRGFWWAHIVWVLCKGDEHPTPPVKDLEADPLVRFQHRFYLPLAIGVGAVLPGLIGLAWGDPLGAVLVAGFLRLTIQWHATFSINSVAHWIGKQPYSLRGTARDSFITAIITLGEGYHNFHHKFQADYRNGIKWYHLDPTKWFVWSMSKIGVTWDLRRTPAEAILRARQAVLVEIQSTQRG